MIIDNSQNKKNKFRRHSHAISGTVPQIIVGMEKRDSNPGIEILPSENNLRSQDNIELVYNNRANSRKSKRISGSGLNSKLISNLISPRINRISGSS